MGQKSTTVALIPARGGSKSIPGKNIRPFCGRPLIYWVLDAAVQCTYIGRIYISTDDSEIELAVKKYASDKVEVIGRSLDTATDTASTESVMLEFAGNYDFDHIVLIQATSPLLTAGDLEGGFRRFFESGADSLVSVVGQKRFIWKKTKEHYAEPVNYDPLERPRRQDFEGFLVENGAFYITSKKNLLESECRISGKTAFYEMSEESYFEMDSLSDWVIGEGILRARENKKSVKPDVLKKIRMLVMDVDGVLTDGGMYYSEGGEESKKFNTRDGKGIELLRNAGFKTAIITSENTKIVERRTKKLCIDHVFQGISDKAKVLSELSDKSGIALEQMLYVGDDVNDLSAIKEAGFSVSPADACDEVKAVVDITCRRKGGEGCIREVCEMLLGIRNDMVDM